MADKVIVKQGEKEVPVEVMADAIVAIAQGLKKLRSSRLNDRALHILIREAAPAYGVSYKSNRVGLAEIRAVFDGIEALERTYLKKKPETNGKQG